MPCAEGLPAFPTAWSLGLHHPARSPDVSLHGVDMSEGYGPLFVLMSHMDREKSLLRLSGEGVHLGSSVLFSGETSELEPVGPAFSKDPGVAGIPHSDWSNLF